MLSIFRSTPKILPVVSVTGAGEVKAKPNIAYLPINVISRGPTTQEAISENATLTKTLIDTLRGSGIKNEDLETGGPRVDAEYKEENEDSEETKEPELIGYRAFNTVQAIIRDIKNVGNIIDIVASAGNYPIGRAIYDLDDDTSIHSLKLALTSAVKDARFKAKTAVAQEGKVISDLKSMTLNDNRSFGAGNPKAMRAQAAMMMQSGPQTQVNPEDITISTSVQVEYFVDDAR